MNRFAAMGTFAPFVRSNQEDYFAGLSFQYIVQSTPVSNLFIYQGNRMQSRTQYNAYELYNLYSVNFKTEKEFLFSHGFGLGYEMFRPVGKKNPLGFSLMAGWAAYDNFKSGMATVEMSILYKFKKD
jgi:hypothetical protein